jgi:hypothetical protein
VEGDGSKERNEKENKERRRENRFAGDIRNGGYVWLASAISLFAHISVCGVSGVWHERHEEKAAISSLLISFCNRRQLKYQ